MLNSPGATGSGKTNAIEGSRAKDSKGSAEGDGLVHYGIASLYQMVKDKAVTSGDVVAQRRRMPGAKAYDVFMESSFVEVYEETARDLFRSDGVKVSLPISTHLNPSKP